MKRLKAIFFDHDGTIVDSEYIHYLHWKKVIEKYSVKFLLQDYIKGFTGVPTYQNALDLIEKYDLRVLPEILIKEKEKIESEELEKQKYPLMPYAFETIKYFKDRGIRLGLVSGADHKYVKASISKHHLLKYFDFIIGGDDVEKSKPAPYVYLRAIELMRLEARECLAIEDTASGIKAAVSAGLECIAVKSKYSETQDFSEATACVNNLEEAKKWIVNNKIYPKPL